MEKLNEKDMKNTKVQELSDEDMEQVSAGYLGFLIPLAKKYGKEILDLFR